MNIETNVLVSAAGLIFEVVQPSLAYEDFPGSRDVGLRLTQAEIRMSLGSFIRSQDDMLDFLRNCGELQEISPRSRIT